MRLLTISLPQKSPFDSFVLISFTQIETKTYGSNHTYERPLNNAYLLQWNDLTYELTFCNFSITHVRNFTRFWYYTLMPRTSLGGRWIRTTVMLNSAKIRCDEQELWLCWIKTIHILGEFLPSFDMLNKNY